MYATETNYIRNLDKKHYALLLHLFHIAKNMFNVGLYESRQYFFNTKRVLSYEKLYKLCKANENYSILPAQVSQQVLKSVNEAMKSFLALSKLEKAGKYPRPVHLPGYLPKDGYFGLTFPGQSITVKNGTFQIPMSRFFRKTYDEGERTIYSWLLHGT